jgi:hypothetical protein
MIADESRLMASLERLSLEQKQQLLKNALTPSKVI